MCKKHPVDRQILDRQVLIALNATGRISRAALCRLAIDPCWREDDEKDAPRRAAAAGIPRRQLQRALRVLPRAAEIAEREERKAATHGCRLLTLGEEDYPAALHDLSLPPPVLYVRGELPSGPAVAMVGSRRMDPYGREAAECFARGLATAGATVVSGFAIGIDTVAHQAAVAVPGGRTVAVLGCGIDVAYPRANVPLATEICRHGAVISEFPLGSEPRPWHFPVRNRVIAALASGVLVIQAALRSGSLITAHHALELGRDIYAVPGRIFDEGCLGSNALLADGALVARTPEDVLESLPLGQRQLFELPTSPAAKASKPPGPQPKGAAGETLAVFAAAEQLTTEEVAERLGVSVDRVLGGLLELELGGWIRRQPGPVYLRANA